MRVITHNVLTAHGTGHLRVYDLTSHSITAVVAAHAVRVVTPRNARAAALADLRILSIPARCSIPVGTDTISLL